ncbi:ankyrin [Neocallimastix lanati (nom. inval.)]|uniref:Ankyrin n=1 Tax=Neocallimastix californiae TaxID=1754190 RepID=A0A1Y2A5V7_9FUNG|nr:ankyrin [Neocallimastix sp. JGI-2020a]ORY17896.1 ankyrin [Neocallimastix californiae]|eukprot:ORY17896.1 ankyrin [Neocallimastix californiae]
MDNISKLKRKITPLIHSSVQRKILEEANIVINNDYTLLDYLIDNNFLDSIVEGHDNSNQCLDLLDYLLTNNDNEAFQNILKKLIKRNCNFLFNLVIKYFFIDVALIIKLLHLYKNKKSVSNQQLKNIIEKRENKSWKYKSFYKYSLTHDQYTALEILLDYNHDDEIIDYLNDLNIFRKVSNEKRKVNYEQVKIIIDHGRLDILKILVSNGLNVTFSDRFNNPPLIYAIRAENYEIINYLTNYYSKIPKLPFQDLSNLIHHGKLDILKLLLRDKINIKLLNYKGKYDLKEILLKEALLSGKEDIVEYLMSCGVNDHYLEKLYKNDDLLKTIVISENTEILKIFIENDIDLNSKDKSGLSVLDYAIKYRKLNIIKYLMSIDVNNTSDLHNQILKDIMNGELDILKVLIDHQIPLDSYEWNHSSCFCITDHEVNTDFKNQYPSNSQIIEFLMDCGVDLHKEATNENKIIIEDKTIHHRGIDFLKILIKNNHKLHNKYDDQTIINIAFRSRNMNIIKYIIDDGKKIEIINQKIDLIKPLIEFNEVELLNYLIEHHLNINSMDDHGYTPFLYSIKCNNLNMMKYLINNGADIGSINDEIIKSIIQQDQLEILKFLVENHLDINDTKKFTELPLKHAIKEEKIDIIVYLINHNANLQFLYNDSNVINKLFDLSSKYNRLDIFEGLVVNDYNINSKNKEGCTLLIYAIQNQSIDLIKYLIHNGAEIQAVHEKMNIIHTLIHDCMDFMEVERNKLIRLLDILLSNYLDINRRDEEGNTILHYAITENKHIEIINYLIAHGAIE